MNKEMTELECFEGLARLNCLSNEGYEKLLELKRADIKQRKLIGDYPTGGQ